MITLMLLFAIQIASPGEMACVGSVQEVKTPVDVYIAGVESEGITTLAVEGEILYLNGPGVSSLKVGSVQRVIRPEGKVRDPQNKVAVGFYYKDIGTVEIEAIQQDSATARVVSSCQQGMIKGDVIVPNTPKTLVEFNGTRSNALTPVPKGLSIPIVLAKDDMRELAAGQFCYIHAGKRDGVKPGDQFVVFRPHPKFNSRDMIVNGVAANASYSRIQAEVGRNKLNTVLHNRKLPPKVVGDIVIVEAADNFSTGKIINSIIEIKPGDLVVKK